MFVEEIITLVVKTMNCGGTTLQKISFFINDQ